MNTVENDLARYQQQQGIDEARDDAISAAAEGLSEDWYSEYLRDGRIDYLDWNVDDITILLFKRKAKTVREVIETEAYRVVQANPNEWMPEPDYSAIEWN